MSKALPMMLLLLLAGCAQRKYEPVEIVHIHHDEEAGRPDYRTIVEFPDGTRRARFDVWGVVGHKFLARKCESVTWCP